ncbi:MAG: transcriptional regulator [Solirubrobacteraceae bacterium]
MNAISRTTGIPIGTVHRWLSGRPPAFEEPEGTTCTGCGHLEHTPERLDQSAYAYLLGLYLGDGHVASFPRTYCLRVYLDSRYPQIVRSCEDAVARVMAFNRVAAIPTNKGCTIVQCYSKQWPCLLPQHGAGAKHERRIVLTDWQVAITSAHARELVRGLIHSDGSRSDNTVRTRERTYVYSRYLFSNRSEDIKAILCAHLDLLGIPWRRAGSADISVARREAVARLDEFVGPKR